MERKSMKSILAAGLVLSLCIAVAATALQAEQSQQRQPQRQQQGMNVQAEPMGWIRIAYDYDNDRYVDAYEYIYAYDLEKARQQSAQRQGPNGEMGRQMQQQQGQSRPTNYVQGQITRLQTRRLNNQQKLVAQVRTQDNRQVPVILGATDQLSRLDLQQGDTIRVTGQRVRLNQQPALRAEQVRANNQQVIIGNGRQQRMGQQRQDNDYPEWQFDQPQQQQMRRDRQSMMRQDGRMRQPMRQQQMGQQQRRMIQTSGTIEDLRQVKLYGQQDRHLVAAIETDGGQTRIVDLGPRSQLQTLGLQSGDRIQVMGSQGTINNNQVIVADRVRSNGESMSVRRTWNRNDFRLKGEVVRTTNRTLPGDNQTHTIALVETIQGSRYPVDLGPQRMLEQKDIDLSEGEKITVIVQPAQAGGKRILEAKKISIDNQVFQRNL